MPDSEAKWYVVHTYSGYENKVASNLAITVENRGEDFKKLIQDIRVPVEKVTEITEGKTKEVERKIFPGYVIIKMVMNDETWHVVRNIRGCTGFVGQDVETEKDNPAHKFSAIPLSAEEVRRFGIDLDSAEKNKAESRIIEVDYKVGDRVVILDDNFINQEGIVEAIDKENNRVRVIVKNMFGRETPEELELNCVKLAE